LAQFTALSLGKAACTANDMYKITICQEHESSFGISIRVSCKAACTANDTYKITICQEHESSFGISIRVSCKEHGQCWYRYTKGAVSHKERGQRSYWYSEGAVTH